VTVPDVSGVAVTEPLDTAPVAGPHRPATGRGRVARWVVLAIAALYFLGPLVAAISFTVQDPHGGLTFDAYWHILSVNNGRTGLGATLLYSLQISLVTIAVTLGLMLPTQLLLHLRLPRWRGLVEVITLLPLVFPPVVLVVGVSDVYTAAEPSGSTGGGAVFHLLRYIRDDNHPLLLALLYVILALPFVYRSLDAGIRSIDTRTLVEAARNLGAGWPTVVFRVLMPCLRTAIVNAAFLCFALVMGEYTIASILLYTKPFPVWLAQLPTRDDQVQVAVSVFSLLVVEAILLLVGALNLRSSRQRRA
jgi:putative spermidine/putrescine transport system permease protein